MARRASINPISNSIELPGLQDVPIIDLLNRQFPIEAILPFLHEVTHHWCFNSPVGLSHALLYADANTTMFSSASVGEVAGLEVRDIYARCLILDDVLEPLYEGLALFAEQNLSSLHSEAASVPFILSGLHFGIDPTSDFFTESSELFTRCRRTTTNIKRKTRLISEPGDAGKSPYLAGYMSVLACFHKVGRDIELFRDPDFFLIYFKMFFFDDLEFAECILRSDRSLADFRVDVHDYLRKRLSLFLEADHAGLAEQVNNHFKHTQSSPVFEQSNSSKIDVIPPDFAVLAGSRDGTERGRNVLNQKAEALIESATINDETGTDDLLTWSISWIYAQLITTRSTLRLASRKVWIVKVENGVGLTETEEEYESLGEHNGGTIVPLDVRSDLPDGPAILECAAIGTTPFFVLRSIEDDTSGNVLTTFGNGAIDLPTPPPWSHDTTNGLASLDPSILTPGKGGKNSSEINAMARLHKDSKTEVRFVYERSLKFHHTHEQPLTVDFLEHGFRGVVGSHALAKSLATMSIFGFIAVPMSQQLVFGYRSGWDWLVSIGEINIDFDEAVSTLAERGEDAGWNLIHRVDSDVAVVIPC